LLAEAHSRWQSDLARYGPALPAAPQLLRRRSPCAGESGSASGSCGGSTKLVRHELRRRDSIRHSSNPGRN
jgi:hypothetical protein